MLAILREAQISDVKKKYSKENIDKLMPVKLFVKWYSYKNEKSLLCYIYLQNNCYILLHTQLIENLYTE